VPYLGNVPRQAKKGNQLTSFPAAIGVADCHPILSWRFAPVHQADAAGSRPRKQARVCAGRLSAVAFDIE
jgi:hypothetical protein